MPAGTSANALYITIVNMAKTSNLNLYNYLKYLFKYCLISNMTDEKLATLSPWNK